MIIIKCLLLLSSNQICLQLVANAKQRIHCNLYKCLYRLYQGIGKDTKHAQAENVKHIGEVCEYSSIKNWTIDISMYS